MIDYKNKKTDDSDLYRYIMKKYNTLYDRWFDNNINKKDLDDLCDRNNKKISPDL